MIKDVCELDECPECGSMNIICNSKRNQLICRECGLIYEPMTPDEEEKFEKVSGIRKIGRGIKRVAGRLRRRRKAKKQARARKRKGKR
jgi:transcription initiation factor TFIIIB Brf1 subunit/transcription initiation factor TFIIB